jgi:energy-coupling factor transport system substrate-specific component
MSLKPNKLNIKEIAVLGMLSALMYASKVAMDVLPNIHLLGVFIVAITVVFRAKALFSIYTFVLITGLLAGFSSWWLPYLYIWTFLWLFTMLLPKRMPPKIAPIVYMSVSALHGFLYGVLYAPAQALLFGLDFKGTIAWIISGLPFDFTHGVSNFICGLLIVPIIKVLERTQKL